MANITKATTGALSAEAFASDVGKSFNEARPKTSAGGTPFLKMDTDDGEWTFGQEDTDVPEDALWGVFPNSFASGFAAWKGKSLEGKHMAVIGQPPVNPETDLEPVNAKDGWQEAVGFAMVCVECKSKPEIEGTMVLYEQTSRGGIEAWNKLFDATMARAKGGHEAFAAIVSLSDTSYQHKTWGEVHKPVFSIEDWETIPGLIEDFGPPPMIESKKADDEQAEGKEVKPASRRRRGGDGAKDVSPKKGEVEDAEVVDEQPARRRRRRNTEEE